MSAEPVSRGLSDAHALVVGIAGYQCVPRLPDSVLEDARAIATILKDQDLCGYPPDHVRLLLDDEATLTGLRGALAELAANTSAQSTVFIYVSSHGGRIADGPHAGEYLVPVDADWSSEASIAASAMSGAELTKALRDIAARKLVVAFDCCHSGGMGQPKDVGPAQMGMLADSLYSTLASGVGRVIMASSRNDESSFVLPGAANSLFTEHMLAALRGGAPAPGGVIRIFDVFNYLQPRVTAAQPHQHPILKAEVEDNFPLALHLGGKSPQSGTPPPSALTAARAADVTRTDDVYVSYARGKPEEAWVEKILRPRLEAAGLMVTTERNFRMGEPSLSGAEKAVQQSRYTLAVLTPAYLESGFTALDEAMAARLAAEEYQWRLVAVLREPTVPPLGFRARGWLDMSDDATFDIDVERLIYELGQPAVAGR
jgi:hypothetical protein